MVIVGAAIEEDPSRKHEYSHQESKARYEYEHEHEHESSPSSSSLLFPRRLLPLKSIPIKKRPCYKIYSDLHQNYEYQNGARSIGNLSNNDDDDDDDDEEDHDDDGQEDGNTRCDDNNDDDDSDNDSDYWEGKPPSIKLYKHCSGRASISKKRKRSVFIGNDETETGSNQERSRDWNQRIPVRVGFTPNKTTQSFASMIDKRIQVQWNMSDRTTRWYTGIIQSCSGDGSEAILVCDEKGTDPVVLNAHDPPLWRPVDDDKDSTSTSNIDIHNDIHNKTTDCYSLLSEPPSRDVCVSSDDDDCSLLALTARRAKHHVCRRHVARRRHQFPPGLKHQPSTTEHVNVNVDVLAQDTIGSGSGINIDACKFELETNDFFL
eukprot:CAMPEP_0168227512 /NCGR_PEP_ID=MMETSP0140_2-20121125/14086_1 /TAXON_ID=44445 /ORGANISM="Pseudo-nitzschia australis, Strain 10249 10 AB" /LENGTH=375 /DNA_ID=CAMNT_0008158871 /DNA_START=47 /DNA_END=1175 /DNA_ORIENTATION=-